MCEVNEVWVCVENAESEEGRGEPVRVGRRYPSR